MMNQKRSAPNLTNDGEETKVDITEINLEDETMLTVDESNILLQTPRAISSKNYSFIHSFVKMSSPNYLFKFNSNPMTVQNPVLPSCISHWSHSSYETLFSGSNCRVLILQSEIFQVWIYESNSQL